MHSHALLLSFLNSECVCVVSILSIVFLTMAPQKFVPSKKPITIDGSSSTSSPSLHEHFHDTKSIEDFVENFSDMAIHFEHHVILFDFLDTLLPSLFRTRGLECLCEKLVKCPSRFIQKFYSNIHTINTYVPQFTAIFRGTCIIVIPKLILKYSM